MRNKKILGICLTLGLAGGASAFVAACDDGGGGGGGNGCSGQLPFVDDWETVLDGPIAADIVGANASLNVTAFQIGGLGVDDNFMNRGDVEVYYTNPPIDGNGTGQIKVEMQRFAGACDQADADAKFALMKPWIFASGSAVPPSELPDSECTADTGFLSGCNIRVYYEGLTQPARDGANIRVFLPQNYRGTLNIITEDNIWPDGSYQKRSNVKIKDLYGQATVEMGSGKTEIKLADGIYPAPYCDPDPMLNAESNDLCDNWTDPDTMESKPWDSDCPCLEKLGRIDVKAEEPEAADITVDAPADFWATINAANRLAGQTGGSDVECTADVACDAFGGCEIENGECLEDSPWDCSAVTNRPSGAPTGTGYSLQLSSATCSNVSVHESPDDYGAPPESVLRGNLAVCSGCLDLPTP